MQEFQPKKTGRSHRGTVMLVAFYNTKALGVRYLEGALRRGGYEVRTVFYQDFNSRCPTQTTRRELELLLDQVEKAKPFLIGLSVMSSMYLDTVSRVVEVLRKAAAVPLVCGGAFASLVPDYFLDRGADYVIRGDGERPLCLLADRLTEGASVEDIPSLSHWRAGEKVHHPVGGVLKEIDGYGIPVVNSPNACFIHQDRLTEGDPQRGTRRYEVIASRGCPFTCSYCSCAPLRRLMPKGTPAVRIRSVESVMEELRAAKAACPQMMMVHFYDEIFPNTPGWVDAFAEAYAREIGLPFTIWAHPKTIDETVLRKLRRVGLTEVIMGIQSGSDRVRREIFHRYESREEIIQATETISRAGVPWVSYDFMLRHPFESLEDLKETYFLVKDLQPPFKLQLHGLNFLPGTDIVPLAIQRGIYTREELDRIMYAPMEEQFGAYWAQEDDLEHRLWYQLTFLWQWRGLRRRCLGYETDPLAHAKAIQRDYRLACRLDRLRELGKKGDTAARCLLCRVRRGRK